MMLVKILSVRKVSVADVRKGDLLIDPRVENGFGEVGAIGPAPGMASRLPAPRLMIAVDTAAGTRAFEFDAAGVVEVAHDIHDDKGYAVRHVDGAAVGFRMPAPKFEGRVEGWPRE